MQRSAWLIPPAVAVVPVVWDAVAWDPAVSILAALDREALVPVGRPPVAAAGRAPQRLARSAEVRAAPRLVAAVPVLRRLVRSVAVPAVRRPMAVARVLLHFHRSAELNNCGGPPEPGC
jgi:hypothetical protein